VLLVLVAGGLLLLPVASSAQAALSIDAATCSASFSVMIVTEIFGTERF